MSLIRQIAAAIGIGIQGLPQRLTSSCVMVLGIAGVVGVLVSVLAMAGSLSSALVASARPDRAVVLRAGATSEAASALSLAAATTIAGAPGVRPLPAGQPAASIDVLVGVNLTRRSDGALAALSVRGMSPEALSVRPEIALVAGRMFTPGLREAIVGQVAVGEFSGIDLGGTIALEGAEWAIVGIFESASAFESALLTDLRTLMSAHRRTWVSSVTVLLSSVESFDELRAALTSDPTLSVDVLREAEYYERESERVSALLFFITYGVSAIMAVGALFAALNTMYSAVGARTAEIAMLRAIGFHAGGVAASVLIESLLLALIGALVGAFVAWLVFSGNTFSLGGPAGSIVAELAVTPRLLATAMLWACTVGLLGGLIPAVRAARLPIAAGVAE